MEGIRGKKSLEIDETEMLRLLTGYGGTLIDLGTGDGRFARRMAESEPDCFVIGVDTCRGNLRAASRSACPNLLFLIADARALPRALDGLAARLTLNFPWGSLLEGLLEGHPDLLAGLLRVIRPGGVIELRLNSGALAEIGHSLEEGVGRARRVLAEHGFRSGPEVIMEPSQLRSFPSTWARRLAVGRDPRAVLLTLERPGAGFAAARAELVPTLQV